MNAIVLGFVLSMFGSWNAQANGGSFGITLPGVCLEKHKTYIDISARDNMNFICEEIKSSTNAYAVVKKITPRTNQNNTCNITYLYICEFRGGPEYPGGNW